MRKIYHKKSRADTALLDLCRAICHSIRAMIGDDRYAFLAQRHADDVAYYIKERQESYVIGTAALIYGSGCAFAKLAEGGLEREAIQMQRHVMEYYFLACYYSKNPLWAFLHWADSVRDEADFLETVIEHHGSRERLAQLKEDAKHAKTLLESIPKKDRHQIRPSVETLAERYALRDSDYVMFYRWPSQIAHATFLGLNYGWMKDDTPRFDSDISNINSRAVIVAEYLLAFIDAIRGHVRVKSAADVKALRAELRSIRTRLRIRANRITRKPTRARKRAA